MKPFVEKFREHAVPRLHFAIRMLIPAAPFFYAYFISTARTEQDVFNKSLGWVGMGVLLMVTGANGGSLGPTCPLPMLTCYAIGWPLCTCCSCWLSYASLLATGNGFGATFMFTALSLLPILIATNRFQPHLAVPSLLPACLVLSTYQYSLSSSLVVAVGLSIGVPIGSLVFLVPCTIFYKPEASTRQLGPLLLHLCQESCELAGKAVTRAYSIAEPSGQFSTIQQDAADESVYTGIHRPLFPGMEQRGLLTSTFLKAASGCKAERVTYCCGAGRLVIPAEMLLGSRYPVHMVHEVEAAADSMATAAWYLDLFLRRLQAYCGIELGEQSYSAPTPSEVVGMLPTLELGRVADAVQTCCAALMTDLALALQIPPVHLGALLIRASAFYGFKRVHCFKRVHIPPYTWLKWLRTSCTDSEAAAGESWLDPEYTPTTGTGQEVPTPHVSLATQEAMQQLQDLVHHIERRSKKLYGGRLGKSICLPPGQPALPEDQSVLPHGQPVLLPGQPVLPPHPSMPSQVAAAAEQMLDQQNGRDNVGHWSEPTAGQAKGNSVHSASDMACAVSGQKEVKETPLKRAGGQVDNAASWMQASLNNTLGGSGGCEGTAVGAGGAPSHAPLEAAQQLQCPPLPTAQESQPLPPQLNVLPPSQHSSIPGQGKPFNAEPAEERQCWTASRGEEVQHHCTVATAVQVAAPGAAVLLHQPIAQPSLHHVSALSSQASAGEAASFNQPSVQSSQSGNLSHSYVLEHLLQMSEGQLSRAFEDVQYWTLLTHLERVTVRLKRLVYAVGMLRQAVRNV